MARGVRPARISTGASPGDRRGEHLVEVPRKRARATASCQARVGQSELRLGVVQRFEDHHGRGAGGVPQDIVVGRLGLGGRPGSRTDSGGAALGPGRADGAAVVVPDGRAPRPEGDVVVGAEGDRPGARGRGRGCRGRRPRTSRTAQPAPRRRAARRWARRRLRSLPRAPKGPRVCSSVPPPRGSMATRKPRSPGRMGAESRESAVVLSQGSCQGERPWASRSTGSQPSRSIQIRSRGVQARGPAIRRRGGCSAGGGHGREHVDDPGAARPARGCGRGTQVDLAGRQGAAHGSASTLRRPRSGRRWACSGRRSVGRSRSDRGPAEPALPDRGSGQVSGCCSPTTTTVSPWSATQRGEPAAK